MSEFMPLMDILAKGAALLAAATLLSFALRRASATLRHRIWVLAFALLILLPVAGALAPAWGPGVQLQASRATGTEDVSPSLEAAGPVTPPAVTVPSVLQASRAIESGPGTPAQTAAVAPLDSGSRDSRLPGLLFLVWVTGATLLLLAAGRRLAATAWIVHRSRPLDDVSWLEDSRALAADLGISRAVDVRVSSRTPVPFAWDLGRALVVLPDDAPGWDEARRRVVLHHELVHLRRRDHWVILVAQAATIIHWMNPLAWYAARALDAERELSCDDAVLTGGARASVYARHLLSLAGRLDRAVPAGQPAIARTSRIERRLTAILDGGKRRRDATPAVAAALLALVVAAAPIVTLRLVALPVSAAASDAGEQAARELEELGGVELEAIADAIRTRDFDRRKPGRLSIIDRPEALEALVTALGDEDPVVRRIGAWGLGEIREAGGIEPLKPLLGDDFAVVRAQAARSLGDIGRPDAVSALIPLLADPESRVRFHTAHALGDIRHPSAAEALTNSLDDEDSEVADKAGWALREIGEAVVEKEPGQGLDHPSAVVRLEIAHAMGDDQDARDVPSLVRALADKDATVREKVAWALAEIADAGAVDPLIERALDEDEVLAVRRQVIRALGEIGDERAVPPLLRLLEHPRWQLRSQSADALGDIGSPDAVGPLKNAADDANESVRGNVRRALRRIGR